MRHTTSPTHSSLNISQEARQLLELCELKIKLQNRAEKLSDFARNLIIELKLASDEQYALIQNIKDIDAKVEHIMQTANV